MTAGQKSAALAGLESKDDETPSARGLRRLGLGYLWCRSKELEGRPPAKLRLEPARVILEF